MLRWIKKNNPIFTTRFCSFLRLKRPTLSHCLDLLLSLLFLSFLSFITIDNWLINNQSINDNWWLLPLIRKWYQDKPLYFVVYMYILHIETIYIFLLTRLGKRGNNSLKADQDVKAVHWPQWSGSWWHLGGFNLTFHRCLWESLNEFFKQCYYQRNLYKYIWTAINIMTFMF